MPILRIEHAVPDFSGWKRAFDSDPADRKGSGVRRYHVMRSVEDPNYVMIDREFDSLEDAEGRLAKMRRVCGAATARGSCATRKLGLSTLSRRLSSEDSPLARPSPA